MDCSTWLPSCASAEKTRRSQYLVLPPNVAGLECQKTLLNGLFPNMSASADDTNHAKIRRCLNRWIPRFSVFPCRFWGLGRRLSGKSDYSYSKSRFFGLLWQLSSRSDRTLSPFHVAQEERKEKPLFPNSFVEWLLINRTIQFLSILSRFPLNFLHFHVAVLIVLSWTFSQTNYGLWKSFSVSYDGDDSKKWISLVNYH